MCYIVASDEIEKKFLATKKYRARNAAEDAGNGFIKNTPEYIFQFDRDVKQFYRSLSEDSKGRRLM